MEVRVMEWPAPGWPLVVGSAVLAGLAIGGVSWYSGRRRRRAHVSLIQEAAGRMAACLDQPPSPTACRHRDLVATLVVQQAIAERLERDTRPRMPEPDAVATIAAVVDELSGGAGQPTEGPADDPGPVPTLDAAPETADLYAAVAATVAARVRQASAVLRHARRLRILDADVDQRLTDQIAGVAGAERDSRELAGEGEFVAALCELTRFDLPVPDDGVPGQGSRRELDRQATWLAELATGHRAEVLAWCGTALRRCGAVERKERTAS
jgi:hypothetical protein